MLLHVTQGGGGFMRAEFLPANGGIARTGMKLLDLK